MKLKRRRALEVPPKIRSFINSVTAVPLDNIKEPLKGFVWDFDKGDFHHWVDLFNHFDTYFERYIKPRKECTDHSRVPLEGLKALQGISGPQRFQIRKAYGAPDRLPSAHTCFNQLDLPEYTSKEQLHEGLLLAIHKASERFGFG